MPTRRLTLADLAAGRSNASEIILRGGQAQADAALRGGEGVASAIGNIGQQLGGAVQAYGAQNDERKVQEAILSARGVGAPAKRPAMDMTAQGDPRATPVAETGPDITAILGKLPPELRGRAMKGIQDAQQTAGAFEKTRLELEDLKGKIADRERAAQEDLATHWGTGAYNLKGHLQDEDGGIGAANYFVAFSGAKKMPGTERLAGFAQQAAQALDEAKASGDPAAVAAVVDGWRKQAAPIYEQGLAALPPDKLKALRPETETVTITNKDGSTTQKIVEKKPGQTFESAAKPDLQEVDMQVGGKAVKGSYDKRTGKYFYQGQEVADPQKAITPRAKGEITPTAEANLTNKLSAQWTTATKPIQELDRSTKLMEAGLDAARKGDLAQGSQAVLVTFQKILDPTSVVRESEYDRSAQGQALMTRARGIVERLTKGGAGIPLDELEKYAALARTMAQAQASGRLPAIKERIGRTADHYGIPRDLVFEDFEFGGDSPPARPAPAGKKNPYR